MRLLIILVLCLIALTLHGHQGAYHLGKKAGMKETIVILNSPYKEKEHDKESLWRD